MGESPEDFTNYWLSRFPLLLVHTWLVMQCVAEETTFSQYYPNNFRYPAIDYSEHEIKQPLVDCEENAGDIEVDIQERADFMSKKSPRKPQKVSFYEHRRHYGRKRGIGDAVGLYRNLGVVGVSDNNVQFSTKDNEGVKSRVASRRSPNMRQRAKKQVEEPVVWKVSEK